MKSPLKNQKGFSILESLLGLAMITLVGSFFISGAMSLKKVSADSSTKNSLYKQINDVIESIRPNVRMYQINYFTSDQERNAALALETLPMSWGNGIISTAEKCSQCPGRYGYVIQSYPGMKGLYLVTVRLSHRDWSANAVNPGARITPGSFGFVDYQFVVSAQ